MRKHLYALAIALISLCGSSCSAQQADTAKVITTLFQCWHAVSHAYSSIYGLEENEIKNYAKQRVCFSTDSISLYSGTVYTPVYSLRKVNAENFAQDNFDCGKDKLGMLADSLYEIKISSLTKSPQNGSVHKMTDIISFDGQFVYVVQDGVIFKLYNHDAPSNARSSN